MQFPQVDYDDVPSVGYEGGRAEYDRSSRPRTGIAEGNIRFGLPVVRGVADMGVRVVAAADALAADADGWVTAAGSGALAAGAVVISGSGHDGVQGEIPLVISRTGVLVTNAHADWDAGSDITWEYI